MRDAIRRWRRHRAAVVLLAAYWEKFDGDGFFMKSEGDLAVERFLYPFHRKWTPCIPPPCPPVVETEVEAVYRCEVRDQ